MKNETLFWDVDTQYDFMRPEGRLYVPGAEGIIDKSARRDVLHLITATRLSLRPTGTERAIRKFQTGPILKLLSLRTVWRVNPAANGLVIWAKCRLTLCLMSKMSDADLQKLVDKEQFHIVIRKEELRPFFESQHKEDRGNIEAEVGCGFGCRWICVFVRRWRA